MSSACVTPPLAASPADAPPPDLPDRPENLGDRARLLLYERAAADASTDDTRMVVVENRPVEADPPPHPDNF